MNKINYFPDNYNVQHKKVILRLDFNVPIKNKIILDDTRIKLCLPFINKLIEKKAKIIIISHLGRPKGTKDPDLSLLPIYKHLKKKLKTNVYFFMGNFHLKQLIKITISLVISAFNKTNRSFKNNKIKRY